MSWVKLKFMQNNKMLYFTEKTTCKTRTKLYFPALICQLKKKEKILGKASLNTSSSLIAAVNDTRDNLLLRHLSQRSTGVDLVHSVPLSTKLQPPSLTLKQIYNLCEAQICELTSFKLQDYVSLLIFSVWTHNYFCPHAYPCM